MQNPLPSLFGFVQSRSYLTTLVVTLAGVTADFALTIYGISHGFVETRSLFWLHGVGLAGIITFVYVIFYAKHRKLAVIGGFGLSLMPLLPITSNVLMLTTGTSPFVNFGAT